MRTPRNTPTSSARATITVMMAAVMLSRAGSGSGSLFAEQALQFLRRLADAFGDLPAHGRGRVPDDRGAQLARELGAGDALRSLAEILEVDFIQRQHRGRRVRLVAIPVHPGIANDEAVDL